MRADGGEERGRVFSRFVLFFCFSESGDIRVSSGPGVYTISDVPVVSIFGDFSLFGSMAATARFQA